METSIERPSIAMARANSAARERDERIHRSPVTRAEIERLKAERQVPKTELTLTPDGHTGLTVDRRREAVREQRIFKGEKRLDRQSRRMRAEHDRTR
ncbi:hypothetical protein [Novosphingobium beihaiensis]|uniref:Uncharacterized protein n=1 Tax=Novosphingobium beihaiensis TaxID=2930389 RepID=A0ABT0BMG7_9SPHN|nr:hypothetical protein [Novosphingobium beihaiensis]MCJ2186246.1 hypothetical protein [Novosphingobium beihaiensis]